MTNQSGVGGQFEEMHRRNTLTLLIRMTPQTAKSPCVELQFSEGTKGGSHA